MSDTATDSADGERPAKSYGREEPFTSWSDFEEYERSTIYSYRGFCVLEYLYWHRHWSQGAIGDYFGVDRSTVAKWMDGHDIPSRGPDAGNARTVDDENDGDAPPY